MSNRLLLATGTIVASLLSSMLLCVCTSSIAFVAWQDDLSWLSSPDPEPSPDPSPATPPPSKPEPKAGPSPKPKSGPSDAKKPKSTSMPKAGLPGWTISKPLSGAFICAKGQNACLDWAPSGAGVYVNAPNGGNYQRWSLKPDPATGWAEVRNKATGDCLDGDGTSVYAMKCNKGNYQKWAVLKKRIGTGDTYLLQHMIGKQCLVASAVDKPDDGIRPWKPKLGACSYIAQWTVSSTPPLT